SPWCSPPSSSCWRWWPRSSRCAEVTRMLLADVALPVPLARIFSYEVPPALARSACVGARVTCAFGARRVVGVVLGLRGGGRRPGVKLTPLLAVIDGEPAVPADLLAFLRDVAAYYLAPVGEVVRLALPPIERDVAKTLAAPSLFAPVARGVGS